MYFNIIIINIFNHILPSFSKSRRGICSNSNAKLFCTSMFVSFAKLSTAVLVSSLYAVLGYLGCLQHSKWHKWERSVPLKPLNERNYSHVLCTYAQKCNFTFVQKCPCFLPSYIVCPCMSFRIRRRSQASEAIPSTVPPRPMVAFPAPVKTAAAIL